MSCPVVDDVFIVAVPTFDGHRPHRLNSHWIFTQYVGLPTSIGGLTLNAQTITPCSSRQPLFELLCPKNYCPASVKQGLLLVTLGDANSGEELHKYSIPLHVESGTIRFSLADDEYALDPSSSKSATSGLWGDSMKVVGPSFFSPTTFVSLELDIMYIDGSKDCAVLSHQELYPKMPNFPEINCTDERYFFSTEAARQATHIYPTNKIGTTDIHDETLRITVDPLENKPETMSKLIYRYEVFANRDDLHAFHLNLENDTCQVCHGEDKIYVEGDVLTYESTFIGACEIERFPMGVSVGTIKLPMNGINNAEGKGAPYTVKVYVRRFPDADGKRATTYSNEPSVVDDSVFVTGPPTKRDVLSVTPTNASFIVEWIPFNTYYCMESSLQVVKYIITLQYCDDDGTLRNFTVDVAQPDPEPEATLKHTIDLNTLVVPSDTHGLCAPQQAMLQVDVDYTFRVQTMVIDVNCTDRPPVVSESGASKTSRLVMLDAPVRPVPRGLRWGSLNTLNFVEINRAYALTSNVIVERALEIYIPDQGYETPPHGISDECNPLKYYHVIIGYKDQTSGISRHLGTALANFDILGAKVVIKDFTKFTFPDEPVRYFVKVHVVNETHLFSTPTFSYIGNCPYHVPNTPTISIAHTFHGAIKINFKTNCIVKASKIRVLIRKTTTPVNSCNVTHIQNQAPSVVIDTVYADADLDRIRELYGTTGSMFVIVKGEYIFSQSYIVSIQYAVHQAVSNELLWSEFSDPAHCVLEASPPFKSPRGRIDGLQTIVVVKEQTQNSLRVTANWPEFAGSGDTKNLRVFATYQDQVGRYLRDECISYGQTYEKRRVYLYSDGEHVCDESGKLIEGSYCVTISIRYVNKCGEVLCQTVWKDEDKLEATKKMATDSIDSVIKSQTQLDASRTLLMKSVDNFVTETQTYQTLARNAERTVADALKSVNCEPTDVTIKDAATTTVEFVDEVNYIKHELEELNSEDIKTTIGAFKDAKNSMSHM